MDNEEKTHESFVVSLPSSPCNVDGIERQRPVTSTPIRKAWAKVATLVRMIWLALIWIGAMIIAILFALVIIFIIPTTFLIIMIVDLAVKLRKWTGVFIISCVAVSVDTLFLYIPIIDDKNKCLGMDKTLRNVALVCRSLTDFAFIVHIKVLIFGDMDEGLKWNDSDSDFDVHALTHKFSHVNHLLELLKWPAAVREANQAIAEKMPWLSISIIINCLAILPIPQVAILVGFFEMGGSKLFLRQTIINVFLLLQYLLRLFQMYLSGKELDETVGKWVKGSFYFFLYIIASHVLGAFWYFFSIQRETSCWHQICRTIPGCAPNYNCGGNTLLNSTILNKLCPINSPNTTLFDFGMYLDILQSGNVGSINFPTKFFYSFWWGLRNLSNFATNLETSSYVWENCFAILFCAIGLLLFLYLIGNVQTYIQSKTEELVKIEDSSRKKRWTKINEKHGLMKEWMSRHGLPDDMKKKIMNHIEEDLLVNIINDDVDIPFIRDVLVFWKDILIEIMELVCVEALKRVPMLQNMSGSELKELSKLLISGFDPKKEENRNVMTMNRGTYIARAGASHDNMYLIIDGIIERKNADKTTQTTSCYDYYGEELLRWAILDNDTGSRKPDPPSSCTDVKCLTKVQAFVFSSNDLIQILQHVSNISEKLKAQIPQNNTQKTVKLNCSSFWNRDTKLADMGWVLRDDTGAFIAAGNVRDEPCTDIFSAGALTIRKAIPFCPQTVFADSMGEKFNKLNSRFWTYPSMPKIPLKMVVESDNQMLINLINKLIEGRSARYPLKIIKDIIRLTFIFEAITFVHCERHCNEAAHCLAKNAKDNPPDRVSYWLSTPPSWLTTALKLDRWLLYGRSGPGQNDKSEFENKKFEEEDEKFRRKVIIMIEEKEILEWMSRNDLPEDMKTQIWNSIKVEKNMDANVDVDFRFSVLPTNITRCMKGHLGMTALKKVPVLKNLHEYVLEIICDHLEPMRYNKNTCVVEVGKPLGFMIFVLRGKIKLSAAIATRSSSITESCDDKILEDGGFYGEQLLSWASPNNISFSNHPVISTQEVKCETKMDALILKAEDLRSAVSKCGSQWNFNNCVSSQRLVDDGRDGEANTGASAQTSTNIEQTIRLHQGHDMILEQLVLIRETMYQRFDDQGRRLDEMAAFLARLGYKGTSSPPPAP